jgi:GPI mannosyltransferase 2
LFNYWTLSNIPLFLLAAPVIAILLASGIYPLVYLATPSTNKDDKATLVSAGLARRLAIPQLVLTGLAATTLHVQIIIRLASGYPLWYMFVADIPSSTTTKTIEAVKANGNVVEIAPKSTWREWAIRGLVCYPFVQAVLFAAFLPPA